MPDSEEPINWRCEWWWMPWPLSLVVVAGVSAVVRAVLPSPLDYAICTILTVPVGAAATVVAYNWRGYL